MRRPARWMVGLAAAGLLAACGSDGAGNGHAADDGHGDMAGVGEPADASDADRVVDVSTLDTMEYDPASITVAAGETVTFSVTNSGEAVHEFTLGDRTMQDEHAEEMAGMSEGMAHDEPNSLVLQPGETKELTWRFPDAGTVLYACHEPGHYQAGMVGEITIE